MRSWPASGMKKPQQVESQQPLIFLHNAYRMALIKRLIMKPPSIGTSKRKLTDTLRMLEKIEQIMPKSWKQDLDKKVSQHFLAFH